jgi:hypothetical protein
MPGILLFIYPSYKHDSLVYEVLKYDGSEHSIKAAEYALDIAKT